MSQASTDLSRELADAVEATGRSVVRIEGRRRGPSTGIVWRADGLLVTCDHVLERDEEIGLGLPEGEVATAEVVGRDPSTDLALLRTKARAFAEPVWAEADALRVGHLALGVSRPGRSARAQLGVVSAVAEAWRAPAGGRIDRYVETDLGIGMGFSGSALVSPDGRMLGLNSAGLLRATSLAVPPATVKRVAEALLAHGRVRRGYLGIGTYAVDLPEALREQTGQDSALLIVSVQAGSAAAGAGLLLGDVLVAMDGQKLTHPRDLLPLLDEERIGQEARLRVVRSGEVREVAVTVGTRAKP